MLRLGDNPAGPTLLDNLHFTIESWRAFVVRAAQFLPGVGGKLEELQSGDPERVGPYKLLGRLGTGGMGEVFLGRSPGGRLVAVKVVRTDLAVNSEFRIRFAREVDAARRVSGLFAAVVVDADMGARRPWLVTNFVNGPTLAQAVKDHGALPVASVLALAAGLAEGLGAVHAAGVVHRDLKPSNVLLAQGGPLLIDFGISQAADATVLTQVGTVVGSPGFMSPEQAQGHPVGPASDVFSLGAVLAFAASGQEPFGSGSPTAQLYRVVHDTPRLDGLPGEVRPLVERCMVKDPAQRPTAAQFLAVLTAAHPSAADLSDWLPATIVPLTSPLKIQPGSVNGVTPPPAASSAARTAEPEERPVLVESAQDGQSDAARTATVAASFRYPHRVSREEPQAGEEPETPAVKRPPSESRTHATRVTAWKRRRWAITGIASAAVLAAGLIVVGLAPWKTSPVLQPTGLAADSSSTNSVAFRWSGPASGPLPDHYEIVRDDRVIDSVSGNVTFYQDTGPGIASSHKYQVVAIRGAKLSPESATLTLDTVTPPVSAALLTGTWSVSHSLTSTTHFTWNDPKTWVANWTFQAACTAGPCNVTVHGTFDKVAFSDFLTANGAEYTGTAPLNNYAYCKSSNKDMAGTLKIQVRVQAAWVKGKTWTATSFSGTVTFSTVSGTSGCNAGKAVVHVASP